MEWDPLTQRERDVAGAVREHFGGLASMPTDMLVAFVRACAHRTADWEAATISRLEATLAWRASSVDADNVLSSPPPQRQRFEELYQAGPVGTDKDGHPVILERVGRVAPAELCEAFGEEKLLERHSVYAREVNAVAFCAHSMVQHGRSERQQVPGLGGSGRSSGRG
eukprot:4346581-Prymnesium_polylepis.2